MARFVFKWRYFQATPKDNSRYVKYIATREGVEKSKSEWAKEPATVEQKRLLDELVKDYPGIKDLDEYETYLSEKTKGSASEVI